MDVAVSTGETEVLPLTTGQLYRPTDLSGLTFSTTAELQPVDGLVGWRALDGQRRGCRLRHRRMYRGRGRSHASALAVTESGEYLNLPDTCVSVCPYNWGTSKNLRSH